jgi:hypothetical protein
VGLAGARVSEQDEEFAGVDPGPCRQMGEGGRRQGRQRGQVQVRI